MSSSELTVRDVVDQVAELRLALANLRDPHFDDMVDDEDFRYVRHLHERRLRIHAWMVELAEQITDPCADWPGGWLHAIAWPDGLDYASPMSTPARAERTPTEDALPAWRTWEQAHADLPEADLETRQVSVVWSPIGLDPARPGPRPLLDRAFWDDVDRNNVR